MVEILGKYFASINNFIYLAMSVNKLVGKYDIEVCGEKK